MSVVVSCCDWNFGWSEDPDGEGCCLGPVPGDISSWWVIWCCCEWEFGTLFAGDKSTWNDKNELTIINWRVIKI